MNTPSPNSTKPDSGKTSESRSFSDAENSSDTGISSVPSSSHLKTQIPENLSPSFFLRSFRDFFRFCLILCFYVAFLTITGIGCPIRFFTGISCPGCGMSRAVLFLLSGHFDAAFHMHPLVFVVIPAGLWLFFGPERRPFLRRIKKGLIVLLVILFVAVYFYRIFRHDPLLSIDPSRGRVLQWFYLFKGGIFK